MQAAPRPRANLLYRKITKRLFDIAFILATSPVSGPLILLLAAALLLTGQRPFYRQRRIGRNGRVFRMLKLRSMAPDADLRLAALLAADAEARSEWQNKQKLRHDPRVTGLGRILRATSLDELPQLWHVLTGDMALVGPRPILESQRAVYTAHGCETLRPGITGLWQVSARNSCSFAERGEYDTAYARRLNLGLDLWILLRTFAILARGEGW
ncbi:sugar transferase [Thioclava sp. BHET1]|nr:sugar transferase [Thioclava sp. BHET1]